MAEEHYAQELVAFLETMWGDGFLSPGGADEVRRILTGLSLDDKKVLDIGCGVGAITVLLARDYQAASVIGIDVEEKMCRQAMENVTKLDLTDQVQIELVEPGPLPFADESFDIVFSKDAILHIPDKAVLAQDVYRVLRPGGIFAASDWLISHGGDPSPEMARYIEMEDLGFAMSSPEQYAKAIEAAGFQDVVLTNRNPWYRDVAAQELADMAGPMRATLVEKHGETLVNEQTELWRAMTVVLQSGEHCPHHIRACKLG